MNRVNASRSLRNWLILALSRIPGRYGVGIFPWLVVLLFSAGAASVPTDGPYESQWVRAAIIISISAWLVQGLALLAVRPWARRLPPTIGGGLITLATFAVLGGIGGAVGVIGYHFVDLPDRPDFFQPIPIMIMATTTWVCVGAIIAISFSWRDHLRDSLAASAARVSNKQAALEHSLELDARQRAVVTRTLQVRIIPQLESLLKAARAASTRSAEQSAQLTLIADQVELTARRDIRSVSHLLHPEGATPDLESALGNITLLYGPTVELRVLYDSVRTTLSPMLLREIAVSLDEVLIDVCADNSDAHVLVVARQTTNYVSLQIERGSVSDRREIPIVLPQIAAPENATPTKWYRVAPAPCGMPWVAISIINAFSVLFATANAGTGKWAAAGADIVVITAGTYGLDLLLRLRSIHRWPVRRQWVLIGSYVGALGALAGAVWGTAIGGETASLALMGLICAFSMGMFLPARRVWSAETKRLQRRLSLTELNIESESLLIHVKARDQCVAVASTLHSIVQSRLLGIAGSIGPNAPQDLRDEALEALADLTGQVLPDVIASLEGEATPVTAPLLTEAMLKTTWPMTQLHVSTTDTVPLPVVPLVNTIIVEAVGNAVKHGKANEITVLATVWPGAVELTIDDNGIGVAPNAQRGLGLTVFQAATTDCSLTTRSVGGSRLHLRVPYLS